MPPIRIAVAGVGYWGRNLVRTFDGLEGCVVRGLYSRTATRLAGYDGQAPEAARTTDYAALLADPAIDAVVIASPAPAHYAMTLAALRAGKHVFVEKPITLDVAEAEDLARTADNLGLVLMVGHLYAYHAAVAWMREALAGGVIGEPWHISARRLNLGIIRRDENAFWSLAPHDVTIILQLFGAMPIAIAAHGAAYLRPGVEDLVHADLAFADGRTAHIHASWLDPGKIRQTVVLGSRGMLVFDDAEPWERKVAIHPYTAQLGDTTTTARGEVTHAPLTPAEPLVRECAHFVECIRTNTRPLTDGWDGVRVLRVLTAGTHALRTGGATPMEEPQRSHD